VVCAIDAGVLHRPGFSRQPPLPRNANGKLVERQLREGATT